jgi:hypothetical protein|tara:strand:- start:450 stop:1382 length:933 start_codon:yes stop_codon:yes gene_type:complete
MQAEDQDDFENATSVEIDDDSSYVESEENDSDEDSSRTNVRENDDDDSELGSYSKKVDKRIKKLTAARRHAEEEAAAAVQYIQKVQAQNEQYKTRLSSLDKGYMSEYEGRITTQEAQAKRAMTEAYEAGEYDKVADAQTAISQIAIEKERLRMQKQRSAQEQQQEQNSQQQQAQQQQAQTQQRQAPSRDEKLESWMGKNSWFGPNGNSVMTGAARAIHNTLVAEEGFDPTSDDYYSEIDKRMRREMPNKFQGDRKNVQSVTPAGSGTRSLKSGRKKQVELNAGQVALAQKLNIPLEKYAAEVAKIANRSK